MIILFLSNTIQTIATAICAKAPRMSCSSSLDENIHEYPRPCFFA